MRGNTIYLEAEDRTQDLLNIKWALRSAGFTVASNWHDRHSPFDLRDHWNASALERLQNCDCVVILSPRAGGTAPELAMIAGFALGTWNRSILDRYPCTRIVRFLGRSAVRLRG